MTPIQYDTAQGKRPRPTVAVIRAEWKCRLPGWLQPFLTWLLGYPYHGQQPLFPNKPWWVAILIPIAVLMVGLTFAVAIFNQGGYAWFAVPVAWLLVVNGARTLQVHICHQGIHENLSGDRSKDRAVVELVSTMIFVQDHDGYKGDHDGIHHPRLASDNDPDRQFTIEVMKIEPGADKADNRKRFVTALFTPKIHVLFLLGRIKANFVTCPSYRRLMSLIWLAAIIVMLAATRNWMLFLVACVLPMTALYHVSAMCQFVTEHFWARRQQAGQTRKSHYLSLLLNRHLGDPLPEAELKGLDCWFRWIVWWGRLLLYHLPVRLGVLVADLPVHGGHHLWPRDKRWTEAIYTNYELAEQSGSCPVELVGSYLEILDLVMESFSEAPPATDCVKKSTMTFTQALNVTNGM